MPGFWNPAAGLAARCARGDLRRRYPAMAGAIGGIPEQLFALLIGAVLLVPLSNLTIDWVKTQQEIVAAQQTIAVRRAAADYIQANWSTVYAWAAAPQRIPSTTLVSTGYLPSGFSSTNAFGQAYNVVVRQVGTNLLEAVVVTTGGTAVEMGRIAASALRGGADIGYIPYSSDPNPCTVASCARGTRGGWEVSLTPYASTGVSAQEGHFAGLLHFNGGEILADYLYRYEIPGMADANRMHVNLSMGGYDITDARHITATGNVAAGGTVTGTSGVLPDLVVTAGSSCGTAGLLGRESDGGLMVCENGIWTSAAGRFGGEYTITKSMICPALGITAVETCSEETCVAANPFTGSCSCPSGTSGSVVVPLASGWPWTGTVQCTNGSHPVTDYVFLGGSSGGESDGTGGTGGGDGGGGGGGGGD